MSELKGASHPPDGPAARVVLGYFAIGDGGGGLFCWDDSSTARDNTGTVIESTSTDPNPPPSTGRWVRIYDGPVNVKWFGALGTGQDEAPAIQAAIDAVAASGGGQIYIPKGTYIVGAPLLLPANCRLSGEGWASILKVKGGMDPAGPIVTNPHHYPQDIDKNVQIANLALDGNYQENPYASGAGQSCIYLYYVKDVLIDNVYCHHAPSAGIDLRACTRAVVDRSTLSHNGNPDEGPYGIGFQGNGSKQVKVTNCHSNDNDRFGFEFWGNGGDNVISNCTTTGNQGYGYSLLFGRNNKIVHCTSTADAGGIIMIATEESEVIGCTIADVFCALVTRGIWIYGSTHTRVIGNSVRGTESETNDPEGIAVDYGSTGTIVEGNHVSDTEGAGIFVSGAKVTIANNFIDTAGGIGIHIYDPAEDIIVSQNRIRQSESTGINVYASHRVSLLHNRVDAAGHGGISASGNPTQLSIVGNHVTGCAGIGIYVGKSTTSDPDYYRIENNVIMNNDTYGLLVSRATKCVISGNSIGDDQASPTQTVGIEEDDESANMMDNVIIGNQCAGQTLHLISTTTVAHNVT
jgi:nitrous oxidase accessory protein NosD